MEGEALALVSASGALNLTPAPSIGDLGGDRNCLCIVVLLGVLSAKWTLN